MKTLPTRRPAEFTAVAASIALLIAASLGLDDPTIITSLAVVIGFIPTAVTSVVVWNEKRKAKAL